MEIEKLWGMLKIKRYLDDPLYRNSIFLMLNTVTGAGTGFIFWLFAARFYPPDEVGLATAIISSMSLLVMLSILGFNISIITYLPHEKNKHKMINTCLTIIAIVSFFLTVTFILGIDIFSPALLILKKPRFMILFILFTTAASLFGLQNNIFLAFRNAKYTFYQNLITVSRVAILPFLITFGVFGIYSSYGLGFFAAFIIGNILILRVYPEYRLKPEINKKMVNEMIRFSSGNYIATLFEYLPSLLLPLIVVNTLGAKMNAYFYVAWAISGIFLMIPRATSMSLFAEGSYTPEKLKKNTIRAMKFIFTLLLPIIIGIFLFGDSILSIFGEVYSKNAFEVLLVLVIASVPFSLNALFVTIKRVQEEVMPVIFVYFGVAIITLTASHILLRYVGLIGVGISWMLGNCVVLGALGLKMIHR